VKTFKRSIDAGAAELDSYGGVLKERFQPRLQRPMNLTQLVKPHSIPVMKNTVHMASPINHLRRELNYREPVMLSYFLNCLCANSFRRTVLHDRSPCLD
jgi:hypothetical protein